MGQKKSPSLEVKIKLSKVLGIDPIKLMNPEDYFAGPGLTIDEISEFDKKIDTKKLSQDVRILDSLKLAKTEQLIEELNNRSDFPIKIKIK